MKTRKLLFLLTLLTSFYGCTESNKIFTGKGQYGLVFKHECTMPSGIPVLELVGGNSIQIIDTLLLVQHQYSEPTFYWDIYNLNDFTHIKSILRRGRGPNEVLFADYTGQFEMADGDIWMYFTDLNAGKFHKINLTESIRSGNDVIELISEIDRDKIPCFAIDNDTFIYDQYNPDKGNVNLIKGDNSWKNPIWSKEIYSNITLDDSYMLLIHTILYNAKNKKACVIPPYIDHIQIIDCDGNNDMILSTAKSDTWPAIKQDGFNESIKSFYKSTKVTDDFIFSMYVNKKISELGTTPEETEIHVFDWDGNAVTKIRLKDHITSFAVDTKHRTLYGIDNMNQLYSYDINACLDNRH